MKIIYNSVIPLRGFTAINLFGVLFVRKEFKGCIKHRVINHEQIHTAQMQELGYIFFYIIYALEFLFYLIKELNFTRAYYSVSFEREAYKMQKNFGYLKHREFYAQWRYKFPKKYKIFNPEEFN